MTREKRPRAALLIVALLLAIGGAPGCGGVNRLPTLDEQVKAAWSGVLNQYQRRADLIPNLVETVKGYAHQEPSADNLARFLPLLMLIYFLFVIVIIVRRSRHHHYIMRHGGPYSGSRDFFASASYGGGYFAGRSSGGGSSSGGGFSGGGGSFGGGGASGSW